MYIYICTYIYTHTEAYITHLAIAVIARPCISKPPAMPSSRAVITGKSAVDV